MWRRLSIGNALIQRLEQDCQAKGITTITATFDHENQIMNALSKSHKGWSDGGTQCLHIEKTHSDGAHPAETRDNHGPSQQADGDQSSLRKMATPQFFDLLEKAYPNCNLSLSPKARPLIN